MSPVLWPCEAATELCTLFPDVADLMTSVLNLTLWMSVDEDGIQVINLKENA